MRVTACEETGDGVDIMFDDFGVRAGNPFQPEVLHAEQQFFATLQAEFDRVFQPELYRNRDAGFDLVVVIFMQAK